MEDSRWYLGGLRSNHVKAFTRRSKEDSPTVFFPLSHETMPNLDLGRTVTLEKIL